MQRDNAYIGYYKKVYNWFQQHLWAVCTINMLYHILPAMAALLYLDLIWFVCVNGGKTMILKVIMIPMFIFMAVSVFRKCVNEQRPYTKYDIVPLIAKEKSGESMPSRHTASFTAIAMAWFYVNSQVGIIIMLFAVLMGVVSVLGGVHFVRDVLAAYIVSAAMGAVGFFLL